MERRTDVSAIDFDTLFEDVSSEHTELLRNSLEESSRKFRLFTQNVREGNPIANESVGARSVGANVMEFGHCPPPLRASLASFDDQVIKYLGDRGGPDEMLWASLQTINIPKQSQKFESKTSGAQDRNMHRSVSAEMDQMSQSIDQDCSPRPAEAQSQESSEGLKGIKSRPKSPKSPRGERQAKSVSICTEPVAASSAQVDTSNIVATMEATAESTKALALQYYPDLLAALKAASTNTNDQGPLVGGTEAPPADELWSQITSLAVAEGSSSSSTAGSSSSTQLGKRGRYFLDIWDEEEFLSKIKTRTRLHALHSWQDLFHEHYTDNHDGCYRDWLVGRQMDTKGRLLDNKYNKKKRPSDPIFWTNVVVPSDTSELACIVPPPVPVAIHHPASWGIRKAESTAKGKGNSKLIDVAIVHPASCSQKMILPVHSKAASRREENNTLNVASEVPGEDVDDFNVYADRLDQQLVIEEASNFIRLSRLQSILSMHENALKLGVKRRRLEDLVYRAITRMEPSSSERVLYAFKPAKSQSAAQIYGQGERSGVIKVDITGKEIPRRPSETSLTSSGQSLSSARYNTRCGISTSIVDPAVGTGTRLDPSAKFRRDLLGASAARHVINGTALAQCLQVGQEVEVLIDKLWQVGTICRIVCDGDHIRHVKIEPQDCICLQSVWVAVEDGRIAPCGTHLRPAKPAATSIKASVSFSSLPAPSAAAGAESSPVVVPSAVSPPVENSQQQPATMNEAAGATEANVFAPQASAPAPNGHNGHNGEANLSTTAAPWMAVTNGSAASGAQVHTTLEPPPPMYYAYGPPAVTYGQFHSGVAYHGTMSYTPADFAAMLAANGTHILPAANANGYHHPPPASYAPAINGAKMTSAMVDPRMQKKQSAIAGADPSYPYSTGAGNRPPNLSIPSIPIRNGVFPYPVANPNMLGARQAPMLDNRVKIPLPLGATDQRDLIPVNAYANHQMAYMAQPPPPQLYGYNRSVPHTLHQQHPQHGQRAPQEQDYPYDPSGTHAEFPHNHVSYDSVGFHSFDAAQPGQVAAMLPQAISSLGVVDDNSKNRNAPPPPSGTFRLGPRGSITKN